ncbi:hypothetical protein VTK56DRAFT_1729 [Thermocarpiscus australiensis]
MAAANSILEWLASPVAPRRTYSQSQNHTHRHRNPGFDRSHDPRHGDPILEHGQQPPQARDGPKRMGPRPPSPPPRRLQVELTSLDDRYYNFTVAVNCESPPSELERLIRDMHYERGEPLARAAVFRFYDSKGHELTRDAKVTAESWRTQVWYRVAKSPDSLDNWKFSLWEDKDDSPLDESLAGAVVEAIDAGATVREVRQTIANHMGITDPNRVVLVARDGVRRGALHGNCWEARQVRTWLCRWLSVDINPEKGYVVLRALKREYVYHPSPERVGEGMTLDALSEYVDTRLLRGAHQYGFRRSKLRASGEHSRLSLNGRPVGGLMPVRWGATYDVHLSDYAADIFSLEETWLLPATELCSVCMENKKISEMPIRITQRCTHQPSCCRDCMKRWLESSVEAGNWESLKCPECSEILGHNDVKRYASKETFDRYDNLMLRRALKELADFHFCLSPTCNSGQIHDPKSRCPEFRCVGCQARHCIRHKVAWHSGETCEEFDRRNERRKKEDQASEAEVRRSTKPCPNCKRAVHKYVGCNHITCVCRHEWCYICLAPYQRNHTGFLFCRHRPECSETSDPIVDMLDNNGDLNELGRRQQLNLAAGGPGPGPRIPPLPHHPLPVIPPHPRRNNNPPPPAAAPPQQAQAQAQQQQPNGLNNAAGGGGGGGGVPFVPPHLRGPLRSRMVRTAEADARAALAAHLLHRGGRPLPPAQRAMVEAEMRLRAARFFVGASASASATVTTHTHTHTHTRVGAPVAGGGGGGGAPPQPAQPPGPVMGSRPGMPPRRDLT